MKKRMSVLMLQLRMVIYKVLLVSVLLAAAEGIAYVITAGKIKDYGLFMEVKRVPFIFMIAFLAVMVILCRSESGRAVSSYTIQRMAVTEREYIGIQIITNAICLLLIYAVQIILAAVMYKLFVSTGVQSATAAYAGIYSSDNLFLLIPLLNVGQWIKNLLMILIAAVSCSCAQDALRHNSHVSVSIFITTSILVNRGFRSWGMLAFALLWVIISIAVTISSAHDGLRGKER